MVDGGRVLAGRYRLEAVIGRGGMAEVLSAHDTTLDRPVAVKVLHDHFADDPAFQERFRREAHAAGSLNHPNVVAVYDTGEQDGLPFIVMERVRGRSLEDVLARGGLTEERSLEVVADVCRALQYAHDQRLVHRDVKPGNILLAEDGQVKVADFGIARAVDADTVTQTAAVLGTAAYLSPEQARGQLADERSDLYALGVVLYELLTGEQPFRGEAAVTVAYQHVQEVPVPPRQLDGALSPGAEAITLKAMAKNPANRYQSAAAMREDLLRALAGERVGAPSVLGPGDTDGLAPLELDPLDGDEMAFVGVGPDEQPPRERRPGRAIGYVLLALVTIAAAAAGAMALADLFSGDEAAIQRVPDVVGLDSARADEVLTTAGFDLVPTGNEASEDLPANAVLRQDPVAGENRDVGTAVEVVLSSGPTRVEVPDVLGQDLPEARAALRAAGLVPVRGDPVPSDDVPVNAVVATDPRAGLALAPSSPVVITVSLGPEEVVVPSLVGVTEGDALFRLGGLGLQPEVVRIFDDAVPAGVVAGQDPPADTTVPPGDTVVLQVSRGPAAPAPSPSPTPTATPTAEPTDDPSGSDEPDPGATDGTDGPDPTPGPTATATDG